MGPRKPVFDLVEQRMLSALTGSEQIVNRLAVAARPMWLI